MRFGLESEGPADSNGSFRRCVDPRRSAVRRGRAVAARPRCGIGLRSTAAMLFVWTGLLLVLLKWLEIGPFATLSWWWVLAPLAAAAVWFEGLERLFGFDRRRVDGVEWEKQRKERVARQFGQEPRRR
jgi:small Trp-rich protein